MLSLVLTYKIDTLLEDLLNFINEISFGVSSVSVPKRKYIWYTSKEFDSTYKRKLFYTATKDFPGLYRTAECNLYFSFDKTKFLETETLLKVTIPYGSLVKQYDKDFYTNCFSLEQVTSDNVK